MAKVLSASKGKTEQEEKQKKRKKQAKKEAKLMLLLKKAKKGVQKAEQKATKAQTNLQTRKNQLQAVEESLSQLHHTDQEASDAPDDTEHTEQLHTDEAMQIPAVSEQHEQSTAGAELQTSSPVEEIDDRTISTSATTPGTTTVHPTSTEEELTISSGTGSMPIVTQDENAWPPPQIREEIAHSIAAEAAHEHTVSNNENNPATDEPKAEEDQTVSNNENNPVTDEPEVEEDAENHNSSTKRTHSSPRRVHNSQV